MFKMIRKRLSLRMALLLTLVAIPLMSLGVAIVVLYQHAAVKELVLQKGRIAAEMGARQIGLALERGVNSGAFTMNDVVAPKTEEIKFAFEPDVKRYHWVGTTPSPLVVRVDAVPAPVFIDVWAEKDGWQDFQDACLQDTDFIYCSAMARDQYVPVPHSFQGERPNGDKGHDEKSRWKIQYNDPLHYTAGHHQGREPLVQDYKRGLDQVWDIAVPIYVKGQHWGAFRAGVLQRQIIVQGRDLAIKLVWVFGVVLLILLTVIFLLLQRKLAPLVSLTGLATRLAEDPSDAELRAPIRTSAVDEIGQMSIAVNRLRASLAIMFDREEKRRVSSGSIGPR